MHLEQYSVARKVITDFKQRKSWKKLSLCVSEELQKLVIYFHKIGLLVLDGGQASHHFTVISLFAIISV